MKSDKPIRSGRYNEEIAEFDRIVSSTELSDTYQLGKWYMSGHDIHELHHCDKREIIMDKEKGIELIKKSADGGYADAQAGLANWYTYFSYKAQKQIEEYDKEAAKLYKKAALQGNLRSIAHMYGVHPDYMEFDITHDGEAFNLQKAIEEIRKMEV